jgi:hypothetical protein
MRVQENAHGKPESRKDARNGVDDDDDDEEAVSKPVPMRPV